MKLIRQCPRCGTKIIYREGYWQGYCTDCRGRIWDDDHYLPWWYEIACRAKYTLQVTESLVAKQFPKCVGFSKKLGAEIKRLLYSKNISVLNVVPNMFRKYIQFNGRSGRHEFWLTVLVNVIVSIILGLFSPALLGLYVLASLIPLCSLTVRRLHDVNKSGYYLLISFIPYVGSILLLLLLVQSGNLQANQYGQCPRF